MLTMESARVIGSQRFGAETINFDEDDPVKALHELTHGRDLDVCVESAGFRLQQ